MAVTSVDLLNSARRFKQSKEELEADDRACISRAYYACYHGALEFHSSLASAGTQKPNCGDHENLIHMLGHPTVAVDDPNHAKSIMLNTFLRKALFNRRLADYDNKNVVTSKNVDITFAETELIFETINE